MTEQERIQKILRGNTGLFEQLITQYQLQVVNTCYSFLKDEDDAHDVAQEVFIKLYEHLDEFRFEAKLSTWLYRVASNLSLNYIRSKKRKSWIRFFSKDKEDTAAAQSTSPNPEERLTTMDDQTVLQEAIHSLPENQQTAFVLNNIDGLSYKEVAETMGVSDSAIESLIFRAKKSLRKQLEGYYLENFKS